MKNIFIFSSLILLAILVPPHLFESFLGIDLKKIIKIILALSSIQFISLKLKDSNGIIIHGFISGLISSTAFTISLAKKSKTMTESQKSVESLGFLSATLAMLSQGLFFCLITASNIKIILFLFPIITTILLMIRRSVHTKDITFKKKQSSLNWLSILKLTIFICIILGLASHSQNWIENLKFLTFIISLFESHGSIVASAQLFSNHKIDELMFNSLIFISIIASYVSKIIIVLIFGDSYLKRKVTIWIIPIILSSTLAYYIKWSL